MADDQTPAAQIPPDGQSGQENPTVSGSFSDATGSGSTAASAGSGLGDGEVKKKRRRRRRKKKKIEPTILPVTEQVLPTESASLESVSSEPVLPETFPVEAIESETVSSEHVSGEEVREPQPEQTPVPVLPEEPEDENPFVYNYSQPEDQPEQIIYQQDLPTYPEDETPLVDPSVEPPVPSEAESEPAFFEPPTPQSSESSVVPTYFEPEYASEPPPVMPPYYEPPKEEPVSLPPVPEVSTIPEVSPTVEVDVPPAVPEYVPPVEEPLPTSGYSAPQEVPFDQPYVAPVPNPFEANVVESPGVPVNDEMEVQAEPDQVSTSRETPIDVESETVISDDHHGLDEENGKLEDFLHSLQKIIQGVQGFFSRIGNGFKGVTGKVPAVGSFFSKIFGWIKFKTVVLFLLLVGVVFGLYIVLTQNLLGGIWSRFQPAPSPPTTEVKENVADQKRYGLFTLGLFGANGGSTEQFLPPEVQTVLIFGQLQEAAVKGETGITATTFYGELRDQFNEKSRFLDYIKNLQRLNNMFKVDVYEYLDRTPQRDRALLTYLDQLKAARKESESYLQLIHAAIDELKVSYESLNPDKAKYESDFFTALKDLNPEKSDFILQGFIDISQKQVGLKARINALSRLEGYYQQVFQRIDLRIKAVEQNKEALISGIKVVEVPGSEVDVVINPQK